MSTESNVEKVAPVVYLTREAAEAVGPRTERQRLFTVRQGEDVVGWVYGNAVADALIAAARSNGYTAEVADKKVVDIKSKLAELSDDELAELGLTRKKVKKSS